MASGGGTAAALKSVKCKTGQELAKRTKDALDKLDDGKKALETIAPLLGAMKAILFGTEAEPQQDVIAQLAQEVYTTHLLQLFVHSLAKLDFECKKDVVLNFSKLVRREIGQRQPTVEYMCTKPDILLALVHGYEIPEIAMQCGQMLRDCIKFEPLAKMVLNDEELFSKFFVYVQLAQFDIAADAFSTFKDLLTNHKILCANFLEKSFDLVFDQYVKLLDSPNYVTRRQSLKLLGELLLDRANFMVMTKYISNPDNLKLMMNMLRDSSKNIQFEAFHVFKVFVANPNKTRPILDILLKNRDKLVEFLKKFHENRAEDEQFSDEKQYLIKQIQELK